ncbi:MAG: GNAT family protein [Acidobacteriota bacterium]
MKDLIELQNDRVKMRTLTPADADLVMEWAHDKEVVKNFSFFQSTTTHERVEAYISEKYESTVDLLLAIFTLDGNYIGNIGIHEIDRVNDTARLGIIIGKRAYWNRGYAQAAIRLLLSYAFTAGKLHKVYLNAFVTNTKGIRLYEKLGFQREGLLRSEYKLRDGYQDLVHMGILAEEFQATQKSC